MKKIDRISTLMIRLALCSAISVSLICLLADKTVRANSPVQFKLIRHQLIIIQVMVNGAGPFDFLLDTGTNTTIIEPELAKELALRPVDRMMLTTVAGEQAVPRAFLNRLAVGPAVGEKLEALIAQIPGIRSLDAKVRGVVGQNFLSQFNYLIDYRERRIEFDTDGELAARLQGARVPFESYEGLMAVKAQTAASGDQAWHLMLDSGATGFILFAELKASRDFELDCQENEWVKVTTNTGQQTPQRGRFRRLRIGESTLTDLPVALLPPQASPYGRVEDGLLPMSLFRTVYVNHRERYVILNPGKRM